MPRKGRIYPIDDTWKKAVLERMDELGIKQAQLARKIDTSRASISDLLLHGQQTTFAPEIHRVLEWGEVVCGPNGVPIVPTEEPDGATQQRSAPTDLDDRNGVDLRHDEKRRLIAVTVRFSSARARVVEDETSLVLQAFRVIERLADLSPQDREKLGTYADSLLLGRGKSR